MAKTKTPQEIKEIWDGLSAEAKAWVLDPTAGAHVHPAYEVTTKKLAHNNMSPSPLGRAVAEYGRGSDG